MFLFCIPGMVTAELGTKTQVLTQCLYFYPVNSHLLAKTRVALQNACSAASAQNNFSSALGHNSAASLSMQN